MSEEVVTFSDIEIEKNHIYITTLKILFLEKKMYILRKC